MTVLTRVDRTRDEARVDTREPRWRSDGAGAVDDDRLESLDLRSVGAVSAIVGALTGLIGFVTGVALWRFGVGNGLVDRFEELGSALSADPTYELHGGALFGWWLALSVLWSIAITVLGVVLGAIVNVACALTGGLRYRVRRPRR